MPLAFNILLAFVVVIAARLANLPRLYDLAVIVALMFTQGGETLGLGALMVLWATRGWGSVRRIPGENRREDRRS